MQTTSDDYDNLDPELVAMHRLINILEPLPQAQRDRLLKYLCERFR